MSGQQKHSLDAFIGRSVHVWMPQAEIFLPGTITSQDATMGSLTINYEDGSSESDVVLIRTEEAEGVLKIHDSGLLHPETAAPHPHRCPGSAAPVDRCLQCHACFSLPATHSPCIRAQARAVANQGVYSGRLASQGEASCLTRMQLQYSAGSKTIFRTATIVDFEPFSMKHQIVYEDGSIEERRLWQDVVRPVPGSAWGAASGAADPRWLSALRASLGEGQEVLKDGFGCRTYGARLAGLPCKVWQPRAGAWAEGQCSGYDPLGHRPILQLESGRTLQPGADECILYSVQGAPPNTGHHVTGATGNLLGEVDPEAAAHNAHNAPRAAARTPTAAEAFIPLMEAAPEPVPARTLQPLRTRGGGKRGAVNYAALAMEEPRAAPAGPSGRGASKGKSAAARAAAAAAAALVAVGAGQQGRKRSRSPVALEGPPPLPNNPLMNLPAHVSFPDVMEWVAQFLAADDRVPLDVRQVASLHLKVRDAQAKSGLRESHPEKFFSTALVDAGLPPSEWGDEGAVRQAVLGSGDTLRVAWRAQQGLVNTLFALPPPAAAAQEAAGGAGGEEGEGEGEATMEEALEQVKDEEQEMGD